MPVTIDDTLFDLLPAPQYGDFSEIRQSPKITFQAAKGYKHQRDAYPSPKYRFEHGWKALTTAQRNTLKAWLDFAGSNAFYYVVPDSLSFSGNALDTRLVRIISEEVEITPIGKGYYRASITLEDV